MKVIAISDTHNLHHQLSIPKGDLLIHAGDLSYKGSLEEIQDFLNWFAQQPHPHKIFIAGNHDFYLEDITPEKLSELIPPNVHYLNDTLLEIEGITIWGSPVTPIPYKRWAFNRERGADIQQHWDLIPQHVDILIVHGPAQGILDKTLKDEQVGCQNLLKSIATKKPKFFIFGHIHEARGIHQHQGTTYINASSVDRYRTQVFPPISFEI